MARPFLLLQHGDLAAVKKPLTLRQSADRIEAEWQRKKSIIRALQIFRLSQISDRTET
ncbi:MAG: hypothetical protein V4457_04345 [Pseudomonadota bacterium]|jgi:hypothetical protein